MLGCKGLTSLDLSSFDTKNVIDMGGMFGECANLISLDLSSFDTSKVTNMNSIFDGVTATTGYAHTQNDATKFNNTVETRKPNGLTFVVK